MNLEDIVGEGGNKDATTPSEQLGTIWSHIVSHNKQKISSTAASTAASTTAINSSSSCPHLSKGAQQQQQPPPPSKQWPHYKAIMDDMTNADYTNVLECPHDIIVSNDNNSRHSKNANNNNNNNKKKKHQSRLSIMKSMSSQISSSSSSSSSSISNSRNNEQNEKAFCPHGVVVQAKMELFDNQKYNKQYTGLLSPNQTIDHCIIRLSTAMKPPATESNVFGRYFLKATGGKLKHATLFPMVALKVLRPNGIRSGNLLFAGPKIVSSWKYCTVAMIWYHYW